MTNIYVFGSNLAGLHGAGSARHAYDYHGAQRGVGDGRMGYSYAIPTKDAKLKTLPLADIQPYVERFISYARAFQGLHFTVVRIGCGLAGYTDADIAPMFVGAPDNCTLPDGWRDYK